MNISNLSSKIDILKSRFLSFALISSFTYFYNAGFTAFHIDRAAEYEARLARAEVEFDNATEKEHRFAIISEAVGAEQRAGLPYKRVLSLAISMGDLRRTEKFITEVDNINDRRLDIWGYREVYTMAHLILNLWLPEGERPGERTFEIPLEQQLKMIDLLGLFGFDFNRVRMEGIGSRNMPFFTYLGQGCRDNHITISSMALVSRAMLWRMRISGLHVRQLSDIPHDHLIFYTRAFDQFRKFKNKNGKKLCPAIAGIFKEIKAMRTPPFNGLLENSLFEIANE